MNYFILIIKGLIIGIGKVIPGVSGSVLAILLNVYEDAINAISNVYKYFIESILYLGFLGIGIIISIIFGSKVLLYFLNNYYFITFCTIIGLVIGTLPGFLKKIKIKKCNDFFLIVIPFIFFYIFRQFNFSIDLKNNIFIFFILGIIEAFTTIIPGISSTAIYISFNVYQIFLNIFSNPFNIEFLVFGLGFFVSAFYTSKLVNFLFRKYKRETYLIIFSLLISSIIILFKSVVELNNFNIFLFIVFLMLGFVISFSFDK